MLAALDDFIVAERAANKADAPARQLAAWLDEVWGAEREDRSADGDVEGDHLVSFLDDGAIDVLGTGTQRSMAATATEGALPPEAALPAGRADTTVVSEPPVPALRGDEQAAPSPPAAVRRAPWLAIGVVSAAAAAGAVTVLALRGDEQPARAPQLDAGAVAIAAPVPDAAIIAPRSPADAAIAIVPADAAEPETAPLDARTGVSRPDKVRTGPNRPGPGSGDRQVGSAGRGSAAPDLAPVAITRKVTINATPWAYFTVDGDPTGTRRSRRSSSRRALTRSTSPTRSSRWSAT